MPMRPIRALGFTLLELLAVLAIIGVLVAIALPAYSNYRKRAMQTVGIEALMELKLKAEQYRVETDAYPPANFPLGQLGIVSPTPIRPNYVLTIVSGSDVAFEARASANLDSDPTLDIWSITHSNQPPVHCVDDVSNEDSGRCN